MPDPTRSTVSATQVPALFECSPYLTRFTLWHELNGTLPDVVEDAQDENERMFWGKRLEPVILSEIQRRRDLLVEPNAPGHYVRHPGAGFGATIDADIRDLTRGPGVVEAKCVDWLVWKSGWTDTQAPAHIELQLQAQMAAVGAGWGVIACLIGGNDLREYDREPDAELIREITERSNAFMQSIRDKVEPDPMGDPMEDPFIKARWPGSPVPLELNLFEDRDAMEVVRQYDYWTRSESTAKKERGKLKTKLLALAKDADSVRVFGHRVRISRAFVDESALTLPTHVLAALVAGVENAPNHYPSEDFWDAVNEAIDWHHVTRKASTRVTVDVKSIEADGTTPPWGDDIVPDKVQDIWV